MRLKIDENLPLAVAHALRSLGHDVEHVDDEGLSGYPDPDIWAAAQAENRFLITQDVRFADARMFTPGLHAGMMLVRIKDADQRLLTKVLWALFKREPVETWSRCFIVLSEHKLRIRRPPE
jgi:predicted nuclease of predicted toxin-antitoxin system